MTSYQTAAVVACRVLGLYTVIRWLGLLPAVAFGLFREPSLFWSLLGFAELLAVPIVLAVILWRLAPWIAKSMLADVESKEASPSAITVEEAQAVAFSILGLLFIVESLPYILVAALDYFRVPGLAVNANMESIMSAATLKTMVMRVTEIVLGTWLFLGARGFVRVFQRFSSP